MTIVWAIITKSWTSQRTLNYINNQLELTITPITWTIHQKSHGKKPHKLDKQRNLWPRPWCSKCHLATGEALWSSRSSRSVAEKHSIFINSNHSIQHVGMSNIVLLHSIYIIYLYDIIIYMYQLLWFVMYCFHMFSFLSLWDVGIFPLLDVSQRL